MVRSQFKTAILSLALLWAPTAQAMDLIVSREGSSLSVYVRLPFTAVESVFGRPMTGLTTESGAIHPDVLKEGTFEAADDLVSDVTFSVGATQIPFEALSMMMHPADAEVSFEKPLDAIISIGVCGVDLPDGPLPLHTLEWVGGWYGHRIDAEGPLAITFPKTGRATREVTVKLFERNRLVSDTDALLEDGGTLTIDDRRRWYARLFGR